MVDGTDASEPPSSPSLVRRLLGLAWRYRSGCLGILLLSGAEIALDVGVLRVLGLGIDTLRHALGQAPAPAWPLGLCPPSDWTPLAITGVLATAVLVLAAGVMAVRYACAVLVAKVMQGDLVVDLRAQVYDKLQRLSFRFFDAHETGSIINRLTSDVQAMREFVEVAVLQSITMAVSLAVYLTYMLSLHVPLTLACLATTPLMAWRAITFSRQVRPLYKQSREEMDTLVRHVVEDVQGVQVIKGFALEADRRARFDAQNHRVRDCRDGIFRRMSVFVPEIHVLTRINLGVLLGYGGWLVISGDFGLGAGLVVFSGLLNHFAGRVTDISNITNSLQNSMTSAQRVYEILDAPVEVADRPDARPLPRCRGALRFEQVGFAYRPGEMVVRDITLDVAPGTCVAILGETGSGKSSLLSLIPRFYDPTAGRLLLDGHDLRDLRLADLRRQVGVVFQESFLFSTTVAANIAFGRPGATRDEVERAARIACAHDFITRLPQGYDTVIGERGSSLSGGQRQRLAIARAVLADPCILLLDDATAAIDPETEHEILAAMDSAMQGRTTFVVAHRLSTLRRADLVVVLDEGHIVEQGTHEQLMASGGRYREAAALQQARPESQRLLARGDLP